MDNSESLGQLVMSIRLNVPKIILIHAAVCASLLATLLARKAGNSLIWNVKRLLSHATLSFVKTFSHSVRKWRCFHQPLVRLYLMMTGLLLRLLSTGGAQIRHHQQLKPCHNPRFLLPLLKNHRFLRISRSLQSKPQKLHMRFQLLHLIYHLSHLVEEKGNRFPRSNF